MSYGRCRKIETIFDGKKDILGSKPNLRGLATKTQRIVQNMRLETANEISRIRSKYFPGFFGRLILSLGPMVYLLASDNAEQDNDVNENKSKYSVTDIEYSSRTNNMNR
jgi:hypothetical protein